MKYFEKNAKDTSAIKDFMAGAEPTGVFTFRNAAKNIKSHTKHKLVGDVGGFVGGAGISAALGGLGTIGLGKLLHKKPNISKLVTMAGKDQFLFFRPKKAIQTLRKLPAAMGQIRKEQDLVKDVKKVYKTKNIKGTKNVKTHKSTLESSEKFTKIHGEDAPSVARKGASILAIGGTAALGGGLNALSAHTQYNAALKLKKTKKIV
jgi:hypothetical protein